jgi:hypothetical protein
MNAKITPCGKLFKLAAAPTDEEAENDAEATPTFI